MWRPDDDVLRAAEGVSKLTNYTGSRFFGNEWKPEADRNVEVRSSIPDCVPGPALSCVGIPGRLSRTGIPA